LGEVLLGGTTAALLVLDWRGCTDGRVLDWNTVARLTSGRVLDWITVALLTGERVLYWSTDLLGDLLLGHLHSFLSLELSKPPINVYLL